MNNLPKESNMSEPLDSLFARAPELKFAVGDKALLVLNLGETKEGIITGVMLNISPPTWRYQFMTMNGDSIHYQWFTSKYLRKSVDSPCRSCESPCDDFNIESEQCINEIPF